MKSRPAVSIAAALAAVSVVAAGSASAFQARAQANVAYVAHSPIGTNRNCTSPGFNSVQAAVDHVPAYETVYLCGAALPFVEQVFLARSVTVTGDPGATIQSPAAFAPASDPHFPPQFQAHGLFAPQAIVVVTRPDTKATIKGIEVRGSLPGNGGCSNREYGVLVLEGFLNLTQASVTNARDANTTSLSGCQFGVGVQVGSTVWPTADFKTMLVEKFTADAEIENSVITGYQKNGIVVDGIGSDGDIHDNIVRGSGQTDVIAQNGIEIVYGATGEVYKNNVSLNQYIGTGGASSTGVLLFGYGNELVTSVEVHDNTLANNDVGISMNNYNDNTFAGPTTKPTMNRAYYNKVSNSAITNLSGFGGGRGYQAGIAVVGNRDEIGKNTISGPGYAPTDTPAAWVQPTDFTSTTKESRNIYKP